MKTKFFELILFPKIKLNLKRLQPRVFAKNIVITGATFGIGEQIAFLLAPLAPHLILVARTHEKLETLQKQLTQLGAQVTIIAADLYEPVDVERTISHLQKMDIGIDIFISNAGKSIMRSLNDSQERFHDVTRTNQLNYLTPVQMLLALTPLLKKNQGQIIHISAINVLLLPAPYWAAYQASKVAMEQWAQSNYAEYKSIHIDSSIVYLPLVRTRMIAPNPLYQNTPAMSATHAAQTVVRLIYSRKPHFKPWWAGFGVWASFFGRRFWQGYWVWRLNAAKDTK